MLKRLILATALAAGLASPALAQAVPVVIQTCGIGVSLPLGPGGRLYQDQTGILCTTAGSGGGGGGGGATGSVTAAGQNGAAAQAVQGIQGGVPQNAYTGQYNATLPTFTNAQVGYVALDSNGRQIISPSSGLALDTTLQGVATSNSGINTATGTQADAATASGANTTVIGALRAIRDRLLGTLTTTLAAGTNIVGRFGIDQTTPGVTNGVSVTNQATQTTTGAVQPPTAASGKITRTSTALTANTSTTIAAANANRIAYGIQCGSGAVSVDETGAALTAASVGNGTLFMPTGTTAPYFTPPVATLTAITAYTGTAQTCVVTEYVR